MAYAPSPAPKEECRYTAFVCGKGTYYISIAVLVLFVLNCGIIIFNRGTQNDIVKAQQELTDKGTKVQQNQVFGNIFQSLVQALQTAAITKKDEAIKGILVKNNLPTAPAPAAGAAPAASAPAPVPAPARAPAAE